MSPQSASMRGPGYCPVILISKELLSSRLPKSLPTIEDSLVREIPIHSNHLFGGREMVLEIVCQ